jgi:hypothetical protein
VVELTNPVVSAIARVEVPSALWRAVRRGTWAADDVLLLDAAFAWDWEEGGRFGVIAPVPAILEQAARLVAVHPLRAADAIQLASALAAARAEPIGFACFDRRVRDAAASEGLTLIPAGLPSQ